MASFHDDFPTKLPRLEETRQCESFDASNRTAIAFRRYRVYPASRKVMRDDTAIEIGGRAFDLLVTLLQARGRVVSKREILQRVWPSITVDECNLRFQMAVLRKALGQDRDVIKTVPGRGYFFAEEMPNEAEEGPSIVPPQKSHRLTLASRNAAASHPDVGSGFGRRAAPLASPARNYPTALDDQHRRIEALRAELANLVAEITQLRGAASDEFFGGLIIILTVRTELERVTKSGNGV